MKLRRLLIVDGYTDEPAGLGVPPYLDVYSREVYGAMKLADKYSTVYYLTIDQVRSNRSLFVELSGKVDLTLVVAGALVPGRYLGGEPLRDVEELRLLKLWSNSPIALGGPITTYGIGGIGGKRTEIIDEDFIIIRGDLAPWFYQAAKYGIDRISSLDPRESYYLRSKALIRGTEIVLQHPNMNIGNLTLEIETYRGCARWVSGGCSFCIDPQYGKPLVRPIYDIVKEVENAYKLGVRNFRLGRQSDILVYGSPELGVNEWPKPNIRLLTQLFNGIRNVAPSLITLHIDNVNPRTIYEWPDLSRRALKTIVEYHTPGDVAALGIESVDPKVVKLNNLKVDIDQAIFAIEVINEIGRKRGWNGLPHLLPGINFIAGLPGESKETWEFNKELLRRIERKGLLVRRVNLRKLSIIEGTKVSYMIKKPRIAKGYESFRKYVLKWQEEMLRKVVPIGTKLVNVVIEKVERGVSYGRQPGSYPITVEIPQELEKYSWISVEVKRHHSRSVLAEIVW
ncbi:radical SAM protein [Ignicoccus islandicus DSM 13165]|uniref:Radical SAM protein n=1 Tax=Ignicoccus islandicus DSM 13165 TaxID=940295 RepID=A0A0U3E2B1_9CREN|nr:radical SAM protein [Ignicoccus islandicus]ALU12059.1 radical SAM protein [Ignicoccus islandicus DSM 13165]